jgi:Flp pilus assembly protein TadG
MHIMAALKNTSRDREQGQATIELALTLPLLLLVVLGVFDFGLMFQRFEVVTNAAREGARLAVLTSQYNTAAARQRALDYLASGGVAAKAGVGCSAGTAGSLCVTVTAGTTPIAGTTPPLIVNEMVVSVQYDHQHVFVGPIMGLFGSPLSVTPLKAVSRMRVE